MSKISNSAIAKKETDNQARVDQVLADMDSEVFDEFIKSEILNIVESCETFRSQLLDHPLYKKVDRIQYVQVMMETHVFCVWDFMCLLKKLQTEFTCVENLWRPVGTPELRHMINSIVLGEECDVNEI